MMIDSERESLDINIDELYRPFSDLKEEHCVKTVRIRSYSGPHFSAFGLNTERYSRMTPNTDTFYAVIIFSIRFNFTSLQALIPLILKSQVLIISLVTLAKQHFF